MQLLCKLVDQNTRKFLQTVEGEFHTRPIYHYHAHHQKLLTLLSQLSKDC